MTRFLRLRLALWLLGSAAFFAVLGTLACFLHDVLPPKPRWSIELELAPEHVCRPLCFTKDAVVFGFFKNHGWPLNEELRFSVRNVADGREKSGFWKADIDTAKVVDSFMLHIGDWPNRFVSSGDDDDAVFFLSGESWLRGVSEQAGKVWDVPLPPLVKALDGVRHSPDNQLLALISVSPEDAPFVLLLDGGSGEVLGKLPWSLAGRFDFTPRFVFSVIPEKGKLCVWDRNTRKQLGDVAIPGYRWLENSPPPQVIINHDALIIQEPPDADPRQGKVVLWDLPSLRQPTELGLYPMDQVHFSFSRDGRLLLVLHVWPNDDKSAKVWDVPARTLLAELPEFPRIDAWWEFGSCIWFSPDGRQMAAFGNRLVLFEIPSGKTLWEKPRARVIPDRHWRSYNSTGALLCFGGAGNKFLFDSQTGEAIFSAARWEDDGLLSADGRYALMFSFDETEPTQFERLLKSWLPERWFSTSHIKADVLNLETGTATTDVLRGANIEGAPAPVLAPGGQALITFRQNEPEQKTLTVTCWDLPAARRWEWIAGLPGALGFMFTMLLLWKWRRSARAG